MKLIFNIKRINYPKKMYSIIILIFLSIASLNTSADYKADYDQFVKQCISGHIAFGNGDYDEALNHYISADNLRKNNPTLGKYTNIESGWDYWIGLVKKRKSLGNINPVAVCKVKGIFIKNTNIDFTSVKGEKIRSSSSLSPEMKKFAVYEQNLLKRLIETFSSGRWTVEFSNMDIDATLKRISSKMYKEPGFTIEMRYPIYESIEPFKAFRDAVFENLNSYDTFVIYWSGEKVATSAGGGLNTFPLVPYQLYANERGWVSIGLDANTLIKWNYMVLLHEFFHSIQGMTCAYSKHCIKQIHEYKSAFRGGIPDWKGEGELDYYAWRFENTLAKIGWERLNCRHNSPSTIDETALENNIDAVKNISMTDLEKAYDAGKDADEKWKGSRNSALRLYEKALKINPYHPSGNWRLAEFYEKDTDRALEHYNRLAHILPNNGHVFYKRAFIYKEKKMFPRAIEDFSKTISIDTKMEWAYYHRGLTYSAMERHEEAIEDLSSAIRLNPAFEWAYYYRALAYKAAKKYNEAVNDLSTAIKINPKYDWHYYQRGVIYYYNLKEEKKGREDVRKAALMGNKYALELLPKMK